MKIVPVNQQRAQSNVRTLQNGTGTGSWKWKIAINPNKFDKLITSLRTAVDNDYQDYGKGLLHSAHQS